MKRFNGIHDNLLLQLSNYIFVFFFTFSVNNKTDYTTIKYWENRQNLHVFNLWPVIYHTKKNSCANPTPETLPVVIYRSQHDYSKSTHFYFVAIDVS
jgi:hypothetical protein